MYALTLPNINRLSKLFHCQNQEKICNNTITKDRTTPQVCRYTTLEHTALYNPSASLRNCRGKHRGGVCYLRVLVYTCRFNCRFPLCIFEVSIHCLTLSDNDLCVGLDMRKFGCTCKHVKYSIGFHSYAIC